MKREHMERQDALAAQQREYEKAEVERETKCKALATQDKAECQRLLTESRARLAELPPLLDSPSISSAAAESELQKLEEDLRRADEALHTQQGQLQFLGGAVIAEQCQAEHEVLERLKAEAEDLEEEMEALRLLLDTIKAQDMARASNLGAALARPVSERFVALAGHRYKQVAIDVGLTGTGVTAAGQLRDLGELSVGTKEQLAILFRLVVASQLKTTLLLDDQLVQSDPTRLQWFLDEFRRCADSGTQIIIFTCRPADYLSGFQAQMPESSTNGNITAIDLTGCVICE